MSKFLLYIFLSLFAMSANAQKIVFDKLDADGMRKIETSLKKFSHWSSDTETSIGLEAENRYDGTSYALCVNLSAKEKIRIDRYMRLLMKTNKGSTIEIKCIKGGIDATGEMYDAASSVYEYNAKAYYSIDKNQILQIKDEGLERMRIELYDRDVNVKFSDGRNAGAYIISAYNKINSRIEERNSFSDRF